MRANNHRPFLKHLNIAWTSLHENHLTHYGQLSTCRFKLTCKFLPHSSHEATINTSCFLLASGAPFQNTWHLTLGLKSPIIPNWANNAACSIFGLHEFLHYSSNIYILCKFSNKVEPREHLVNDVFSTSLPTREYCKAPCLISILAQSDIACATL